MRQLKIIKQITNRESQSLDKYLQEIGRVSLITPEMEVELAKRIRQGDTVALEKLTKANLRFVVSVAKQFKSNSLTLGDLINEGNVGLIKAAMRFDETRGFKFISYAVWWIRQSIMQALAEQSRIVRLPLNRIGSVNKMLKTFSELEQQYQREPTAAELADVMDIPLKEMQLTMQNTSRQVSIDAPFSADDDNGLLDVLHNVSEQTPDSDLMHDSLQQEISRVLDTLTVREADILSDYYGLKGKQAMSLEEIGLKHDLTRERVRQIKEKATVRLRTQFRSHGLRSFLG